MSALKELPDLESDTCWICGNTPAKNPGYSELTGMEVQVCDDCFSQLPGDSYTCDRCGNKVFGDRACSCVFKRECAICGETVDVRSGTAHALNNDGKSVHRRCLPQRRFLIGPPRSHLDQREFEEYQDAIEFDRMTHER